MLLIYNVALRDVACRRRITGRNGVNVEDLANAAFSIMCFALAKIRIATHALSLLKRCRRKRQQLTSLLEYKLRFASSFESVCEVP